VRLKFKTQISNLKEEGFAFAVIFLRSDIDASELACNIAVSFFLKFGF